MFQNKVKLQFGNESQIFLISFVGKISVHNILLGKVRSKNLEKESYLLQTYMTVTCSVFPNYRRTTWEPFSKKNTVTQLPT